LKHKVSDCFEEDLVSVLIPLYNRIDYIKETIESVTSQDYEHIELIVVDDGSTDGSFELVSSLADKYKFSIYFHDNRENKGQSAALNLALSKARGEFISILDSDDLFSDGKISKQVEFFKKNPKIDIVYGMGQGIDSKGNYLYDIHSKEHQENNDPNLVLLDCYFLLPQNSLVRRTSYQNVGFFNESYRSAQDHDMLIRLCEVSNVAFIPELLFYYRKHAASISSTKQHIRWFNGLKILESASLRYPYKKNIIRKRKALVNYRLAMAYIKQERNYLEATWRILYAGLLDPIRAFKVVTGVEKNY
jgi:glycosyltransferase involved in cell wall biosynthesis